MTEHTKEPLEVYLEEMRRLNACTQACRGIPTEALEAGIVGEMVEALRFYQDQWVPGNYVEPFHEGTDDLARDGGSRARSILSKLGGTNGK